MLLKQYLLDHLKCARNKFKNRERGETCMCMIEEKGVEDVRVGVLLED